MEEIKCAIYTRKSTDEGLEKEFNTLEAQREAGENYVKSQKHQGWILVDEHYDDGGFSGGNMKRPALQRLFKDIELGKINMIVVYKIDRLTRSLVDFSKMVDIFDKYHCSFVSVTQNFNTSDSMGRLTLNMPRRCISTGLNSKLMNYGNLYGRYIMNQQLPRGIRNNNPGNIRWGANWQGLNPNGKEIDPYFCVFQTAVAGIRALAKVLINYKKLYGLNTVRQIISRYAPPNENQTTAYVQSVARQLGVLPDVVIDIEERGVLTVFVKAVIRMENGIQPYSDETIQQGINSIF